MPDWFISSLALLSLLLVLKLGYGLWAGQPRYTRIAALFTPAERRFLQALREALPPEVGIFGKVRVADVLEPSSFLGKRHWRRQFWKISSKHLDYVLVDGDARILCAIELDDRSHLKTDRMRRDRFLNAACRSAGLPLLRFPVRSSYDLAAIRQQIANELDSNASRQARICPNCSSPLVVRRNRNKNRRFLGCSRYPDCRFTTPLSS